MSEEKKLKRTLGPLMLWGLGVGYVISGMYFGWNLGLEKGGTLGMAIATLFITVMYVTFTFGYTELACAIPRAGGVFDYAHRSLGKRLGFLAGMAQNVEFIFAPPAIAFAIAAYLKIFIPGLPILVTAVLAYFIFTAINVIGVKTAASFELIVTVIAVFGLLLFAGVTLPHIQFKNLTNNALPHGFAGSFAAIPFAIWFFMCIEGVANVAEETVNPQRNVLIGFGSAIATLVALCAITFTAAVGVGGWEKIVYTDAARTVTSDSPLPLAFAQVMSTRNIWYQILGIVGLFGLVASFHGIILAGGRATFEFGRIGNAPGILGKIHGRFKTPANALVFNMLVGIVALLTGKTAEIITIAAFGALTLYILSMISLLVLRKKEPNLERPFRVPLYPWFPLTALVISVFSLVALVIYNGKLALVYAVILILSYLWFLNSKRKKDSGKQTSNKY